MTTRNPNNERYMNSDEKPQGKTRKSAASAKPVTKAASSVHIQNKSDKAAKKARSKQLIAADKQKRREQRRDYLNPQTPEYKKWHTVWVVILAVAIVLTVSGLLARNLFHVTTGTSMGIVIAGDIFLVFAILLDIFKLSKMRSAYAAARQADKSKKANAKRKEEAKEIAEHDEHDKKTQEYKAAQKVKAEEAQAKEEKKEEKKKKSRNPFSVKNV